MHILVAPNAFKNSLTAEHAAEAISKGLKQSSLSCTTTSFPIGDGGDGTGALLSRYLGAKKISKEVTGPIGKKIKSFFYITPDHQTAIIELADASGLRLLKKSQYDQLHATSFGTGELISHALNKGAKKILLCIGGSATVDGGIGIIRALGGKFYNSKEKKLKIDISSFTNLRHIDLTHLNKKIKDTDLIILCDVNNSLLGKKGAAAVFGPQKGAGKKDIKKLEASLQQLGTIVKKETGKNMAAVKHGGAAGGVAAGLYAMLNAKLVTGIDYFLDITGFDKELERANLLITGEGSIDTQTLHGKAPYGVAKRAKQKPIPVIALAGKVPLRTNKKLQEYFDVLLPISHESMDLATAIKNTSANLVRSSQLLGDFLQLIAKS